jgi:hypothetical protein
MRRRSRNEPGSSANRRRTSRHERATTTGDGLPDEVLRQIEVAPLFQVTSLDGKVWYDPYEGHPVPLDNGRLDEVARRYLAQLPRLGTRPPLPWRELQFRRWLHELPTLLRLDPRFAVLGPGGSGWAEPFTGTWQAHISAPGNRITRATLQQMAHILADTTQLALGEPLSVAELARCRPTPSSAIPEPVAEEGNHELPTFSRPHPAEEPQGGEFDEARAVQHHQLDRIPEMPGYDCAVHYEGHSAVSGDIYAVLPYGPQRHLILVGDVSGHGMQAALIVSPLLKILRLLAPLHPDPVDLLATVNDEIRGDLLPGQFVTLAVAVIQTDTDMCEIVLAGHHPFAIINPRHEHPVHRVGRMGMALGLASGALFRNSLRPIWLNMQDGDILLQCSDGILEAKEGGEGEREFGLLRFWGSALSHYDESATELVHQIATDANHFAAYQISDDVCILALARPLTDPHQRGTTEARLVHSQPRMAATLTINGRQAADGSLASDEPTPLASDELESVFDEVEIDPRGPDAQPVIDLV